MSKIVKIPECANPFVVHVNGKVYSYTAGTEQTVPDEVAVVIEAHNKKHEESVIPVEAPFASGGGLPVVDLSEATMASIFSTNSATCTAEEHAVFRSAIDKLSPVIVKGSFNGIVFSGVSNILVADFGNGRFVPFFEADTGMSKLHALVTEDSTQISLEAY